ncbi:MAG: glycosyltransferase, partial [Wenzhouxiangellaceae bacterium]
SVSEAELRAWKASREVEFLGQVDDMPTLLNALDVFVLPSYREGLSRSLIEAGAAGLPAVTTNVPGCRDVVRDGDNGLLVEARDVNALVDAMGRLLRSDDLRKRMSGRARGVVVERFSNDVINGATLALYRKIMQDSPPDSTPKCVHPSV